MFPFFCSHHHRHHGHHGPRMGLWRIMMMCLFFGPWVFRRMMRWQQYDGGPGWHGGPRWHGGPGWHGGFEGGPRGSRGPRGVDYV